jgi:SAM-dependent methyltransferase
VPLKESTIRNLPPIHIEGHHPSGAGGPDHPMRMATRRAAGLDAAGWTRELRDDVEQFFDDLAGEWHTRTSPARTAIVTDALVRGLDPMKVPPRLAVEVGSGIGTYSPLLAERFASVLALDLSRAMLRLAPVRPAHRVQADGARLPVRSGSASAIVLINAFLFPAEVERVLSPQGALVWVNLSGEQTPIYLSAEDLVTSLPGRWTGVSSRAGEGHWCVVKRTDQLFPNRDRD